MIADSMFAFCPEHYSPLSSVVPNGSGVPGDKCYQCRKEMLPCKSLMDAVNFQRRLAEKQKAALGMGNSFDV
jgi:hypothetical protein